MRSSHYVYNLCINEASFVRLSLLAGLRFAPADGNILVLDHMINLPFHSDKEQYTEVYQ